jgi:molecular chaperone HscB
MIDFSQNYFELFGLPASYRFDEAELDRVYRELQTRVHPDRHAAGSEADKRLALQSSARLNEAYRALKDPVARAQHLLALHGIASAPETDTRLPLEFLERQLERRERAEEAFDARDERSLAAVASEVGDEAGELEAAIAQMLDRERAYENAASRVRELKFLSKLGDDLHELAAALDD